MSDVEAAVAKVRALRERYDELEAKARDIRERIVALSDERHGYCDEAAEVWQQIVAANQELAAALLGTSPEWWANHAISRGSERYKHADTDHPKQRQHYAELAAKRQAELAARAADREAE